MVLAAGIFVNWSQILACPAQAVLLSCLRGISWADTL